MTGLLNVKYDNYNAVGDLAFDIEENTSRIKIRNEKLDLTPVLFGRI